MKEDASLEKAYQDGYAAKGTGLPKTSCPYSWKGPLGKKWLWGWFSAERHLKGVARQASPPREVNLRNEKGWRERFKP